MVTWSSLALSGGSAINDTAAIILGSSANLQLDSSETIRALAGDGSVALGGNSLTLAGNDTATFGGAVNGSGGLVKNGAGTLTLSGANGFTGGLQIATGSVAIGASERLADTGSVAVSAGATFDLADHTETIGGLTGAGSVALGSGTLVVSSDADGQFDGQIGGTGGVSKSGSGTFLLTGISGYTGATTAAIARRGRYRTEKRYIRKDGEIVHIMWSARWSPRPASRFRSACRRWPPGCTAISPTIPCG